MTLTYSTIDLETASRECILREINRLEGIKNERKNEEQGVKIFSNSIYGASASPFFAGYNINVAEAITLQGQDLIFFGIKILNGYFKDRWYKDKELHEKMVITEKVEKVSSDAVVYGDTDSFYLSFHDIIKSCNWPMEEGLDFILKIYEFRLKEYIIKCFEIYAKKDNVENVQSLDLEKIAYSGIIVAKKKYVLDLAWKEPGINYKHLQRISSTGVELVQASTPRFCRTHLKDSLITIFKEKSNLNLSKFTSDLRDLKSEFKLTDVIEISKNTSINNYEKYIVEDNKKLTILPRCPIHLRAAAVYNFKINNNPALKRKYPLLKSGDKVTWYYAKPEQGQHNNPDFNVFAFPPYNYPYEMATPVDYDVQFSKVIIEPINRFIKTMKFGAIPSNLITSKRLF